MSPQRHTLLGLLFILVIGILSWFTLFKTDVALFSERYPMTVHFHEAGGLRAGDTVLVAGMRWGTVENLTFDPTADPARRVTVGLSLEDEVALFGDHRIVIEDATVLGGKQLSIEPGLPSGPPVSPDAVLYGDVSPNVMAALGEVVTENREAFTSILRGLEDMVADVQGGDGVITQLLYDEGLAENLSRAVTSVSATFENAEALTRDLRQGEGTIGKLLYDTELYGQIQDITANLDALLVDARAVAADVRAGKGTVGALLHDEEMREDVRAAIDRVAQIVDDVNEGRGTLGRLVKDGAIADDLEQITSRLAAGEGTIGRLLQDDEVYENIRSISEDLASAGAALRDREGTIGRLVYEDDLYVELERAVRTLTGTLEEAREAAPISTFLNTVFLGF